MDLGWRIVTTGHDDEGRERVRSDRSLTVDDDGGSVRVGHVLALRVPATSVDDGEITEAGPTDGVGSLTVDALVVEPTAAWLVDPDEPASGAFEAYIVVRRRLDVVVGADHAELGVGEVFVPRGQAHGIRTTGAEEVRLVRVSAVPDPTATPAEPTSVRSASGPATWVRRVVAGTDESGRPGLVQDGDPAVVLVVGDEALPMVVLADVWEFGERLTGADGGGDVSGPYELEPRGGGGKLLYVRLAPVQPHDPNENEGWHTTPTIDVDIVIAGAVHMYLPDLPPIELQPGDILLQRGTNHLWQSISDEPLQMMTVMLGVRH